MNTPDTETVDTTHTVEDFEDGATNYHATVDDLRRTLLGQSAAHQTVCDQYMTLMGDVAHRNEDKTLTEQDAVIAAAVMGNSMASNYAYTLAATLRVARDQLGEEAARTLAFEMDEMMTNGDIEDVNGDIAGS